MNILMEFISFQCAKIDMISNAIISARSDEISFSCFHAFFIASPKLQLDLCVTKPMSLPELLEAESFPVTSPNLP